PFSAFRRNCAATRLPVLPDACVAGLGWLGSLATLSTGVSMMAAVLAGVGKPLVEPPGGGLADTDCKRALKVWPAAAVPLSLPARKKRRCAPAARLGLLSVKVTLLAAKPACSGAASASMAAPSQVSLPESS